MSNRKEIKIDRDREMRAEGISKMISEGGLGADKYYNIVKHSSSEIKDVDDEGQGDKEAY